MSLVEKQKIAAVARTLIKLLLECDDSDFVETVVQCICDGDKTLLEVHLL